MESEGTVTSSERRVQRVRKALEPPGEAREDSAIVYELARRSKASIGAPPTREGDWNECRSLSPWHAGMSYARLEKLGGIPWPCYDENHPGETYLHGTDAFGKTPSAGRGRAVCRGRARPAGRSPRRRLPAASDHRTTAGSRSTPAFRAAEATSPLRRGDGASTFPPADAARLRIARRRIACASARVADRSRRSGSADRRRPRAGLVFMTPHFNDDVATNLLTIDATDPEIRQPREFKAAAVRIERV